jgi:hypothetical protein
MKKIILWIMFIISLIYGVLSYIQILEIEENNRILSNITKNNKYE